MDRPCPSPPTHVPRKRGEPQEPTWRRVMPKATPQKVEPQEPAPRDKGKHKVVDVTNIVSSSTSMTPTLKASTTEWIVKPKVVTQEPTMGKTNCDRHMHISPPLTICICPFYICMWIGGTAYWDREGKAYGEGICICPSIYACG